MTTMRLLRGNVSLYLVVAGSSVVTTIAFGVILWRLYAKVTPQPGPTEERKSRIVEVSEEDLKQLAASRNSSS